MEGRNRAELERSTACQSNVHSYARQTHSNGTLLLDNRPHRYSRHEVPIRLFPPLKASIDEDQRNARKPTVLEDAEIVTQ